MRIDVVARCVCEMYHYFSVGTGGDEIDPEMTCNVQCDCGVSAEYPVVASTEESPVVAR